MTNNTLNENDQNIETSIRLINEISVYAKTATHVTMQLGSSIKGYVFNDEEPMRDLNELEYMEDIEDIVSQFNKMIDLAIAAETGAIKRKEDLLKIKLARKVLSDWQPLALLTNGWITALYEWFQYRIDLRSKSYLNNVIANIKFKEV